MARRADQRKHHYIYKITRTDGSGKYYIGMHSTDDLDDGYFGSGSLLSKSIKKHGKDKHVKEILEHLPSREALKLREKELVNEELLGDKKCMNLKLGGEGGFDHLNDRSEAHKNRRTKGTINSNRSPNRNWAAQSQKGHATRKANGNPPKRTFFQGMLGKKHSEESKQRMSESRSGDRNGSFGTCWVTNGMKPIKVKKEQLGEYLSNGYSLGRKCG